MRLSTVFVSTAFVLAGTSAALPVERENMLVARFADSDFLAEVEARAYNYKGLELYTRSPRSRSQSRLLRARNDDRPAAGTAHRAHPPVVSCPECKAGLGSHESHHPSSSAEPVNSKNDFIFPKPYQHVHRTPSLSTPPSSTPPSSSSSHPPSSRTESFYSGSSTSSTSSAAS